MNTPQNKYYKQIPYNTSENIEDEQLLTKGPFWYKFQRLTFKLLTIFRILFNLKRFFK